MTFLSLNIHEALTFETEVCLHPDLFTTAAAASSNNNNNATTSNNNNVSDAATISSGGGGGGVRHSLVSNNSTAADAPSTTTTTFAPLQAGDLIEVRVWDGPTTGTSGAASYHSSASNINILPPVLRRRPSPPQTESMASSVAEYPSKMPAAAAAIQQPSLEDAESTSLASSTDPRSTTLRGGGGGGGVDTTTLTPHVSPHPSEDIKSAALPPLPFPRQRAGTTDGGLMIKRRAAPQPPPPPPTPPPPPIRNSPKQQPRHVREISDISADTALWAGTNVTHLTSTTGTTTTLDSSHQLVDLQVPFGPTTSNISQQHPSHHHHQLPHLDDVTADEDDIATGDHHHHSTEDDENASQPSVAPPSHTLRLKFYILVNEASLTSLKPSARTQISLLRQVADLYNLSSYDMVTVHQIADQERVQQEMAAEFVLVTIKDQYLSRGDLHFFQQSLQGCFLYEGQRLTDTVRGIQAHAREIRNSASGVVPTGLVTEHTKIAYRSRSSRIFWLVQMSAELWDYSAPFADGQCQVYFDKFMAFVYELFEKWKSVEVTHSLTVVFFSRTFLNANHHAVTESGGGGGTSTIQKDVFGRYYEDHYRMVIENETRADWASLILQIRQAFWKYPAEVGWNLASDDTGRWPSTAGQGNVLEAINVTLNLLQYHYLDRDLHRTGNSIVVVSAGNGVFEVSKELSQITYQRMMDNGIGSDMLSLGLPPLHTAPFFMYVKEHQSVGSDGVDSAESYFEVPHWMHLSFVSYDSDTRLPTDKKPSDEEAMDSALLSRGRIEIGPGGFILRKWSAGVALDGKLSPRLNHVNTPATTPSVVSQVKQRVGVSKERQLIAGRDFSDILRASRPRFSASLPATLRSLLKSHGREQSSLDKSRDDSVVSTHSGSKGNIREWNSMDSDEASEGSVHIRSRGVSLGQDPRDGESPLLVPKSPPRVDVLDGSSHGSPSSSFSNQLSVGALASSLERHQEFLVRPHHMSPKMMGMQLQRARSMEFDAEDQEESETIESYQSTLSIRSSGAEKSEDQKVRKMLDLVKNAMKTSDNRCLKAESPKLITLPAVDRSRHSSAEVSTGRSFRSANVSNLSKSPKFGPRTLSSRSIPNQAPATSGGIGAALSQYRGSAASLSSETEGSGNLSRASSYGRIHNNALLRIPEMISAGISPLLLPPTQPPLDNAQEAERPSSGPERRLERVPRIGSVDGNFIRPMRGRQFSDITPGSERRVKTAVLGSSPPKPLLSSGVNLSNLPSQSKRTSSKTSKKKKAFNPFRQQDEDAVLAEKSHNRRRWSHVFPATEVEFKRHAGPNWKSLSAPAILPISVDYFPPQAKIDLNFRISQYSINVSDFENRNFSSTKFLLMEMVRQRVTQDFQVVPRSNVNASNYRKEWLSRQVVFNERPNAPEEDDQGDPLRMFLSMGHRLQVLSYVPSADTVHVTQYTERTAADESSYRYYYMNYSKETKSFVKCAQSFQMYASPYNWNKVDRILSGDTDRELREGMRAKRQMFIILPEPFSSSDAENKYVAKFKRLLDYFAKLRPKGEAEAPVDVKIVTSSEQETSDKAEDPFDATPGIEGKAMVRFYLPLRKGRGVEQFEYAELSLDATFNTTWTYRIMVSWLSASTTKMDTQIQSLQRRCTQYGLTLIPAPHVSVSRSVFLNPFRAPTLFSVRDRFKVPSLYAKLPAADYIYDGVFPTEATSVAECIEGGSDFKFRRWGKQPHARQFIHRTGSLFVRIIVDRQGWALIVAYANYRLIGRDEGTQNKCCAALRELRDTIDSLNKQ